MKVALIDNMNNMFFAFARYLRDLDVYCISNSDMNHFSVNADTFLDTNKLNIFLQRLIQKAGFFSIKNKFIKIMIL